MVDIPDSFRAVFTGILEETDGRFVIEVPQGEIEHSTVTPNSTYRVAIFEGPKPPDSTVHSGPSASRERDEPRQQPTPPVEEVEMREVTIETLGDQGDGIAKVERGYVVIVPDAQPGEEPLVEIKNVRPNVAFASVVETDPRTL